MRLTNQDYTMKYRQNDKEIITSYRFFYCVVIPICKKIW